MAIKSGVVPRPFSVRLSEGTFGDFRKIFCYFVAKIGDSDRELLRSEGKLLCYGRDPLALVYQTFRVLSPNEAKKSGHESRIPCPRLIRRIRQTQGVTTYMKYGQSRYKSNHFPRI